MDDGLGWRTVAFWFYEGMDHPFWENVGEDGGIYVSIWMKSTTGFGSSRRFMTYQPSEDNWSWWAPDQNNFNAQYQTFPTANGWQELRMEVSVFKKLKKADGYYLGVLFWNLEDHKEGGNYITVWGAEVMCDGIEQPAGPLDVKFDTAGLPYSDTHEWSIYRGEKKLVRGKDYSVDGTTVYGLDKGEYTVVYDFSMGAYEEGTILQRAVTLK